MREITRDIEETGARLVVVGNGTPEMLEGFLRDFGSGLDHAYTDPTRRVYDALGARQGSALFFLDPRVWFNALRALLGGSLPGRRQGDAAQLGGVWVVRPDGEAVFEHLGDVAGDYPSNQAILDVLPAAARTT